MARPEPGLNGRDNSTEGGSTPKRGADDMKQDHEIADQPSPALREQQEHPVADAELELVSGGVKPCTGILFIKRNGQTICIGQ
jgi:hypothetical protein